MAADVNAQDGVARAIEAAQRVFDDPRSSPGYEPRGAAEIGAAVTALAERFRAGGGTLNEIIQNARAAAEVLSDDPFQALSECIQNADDVGAARVRVILVADALVVVHDGRPLALRDAHALAAPWLTTKREDSVAVGRFGIGLMTLSALADSFEMHSGDYHVRFGAPTLEVIPARTLPNALAGVGETVLYVQLRDSGHARERLLEWANRWDDAALLFLRSVRTVDFSVEGETRSLALGWGPPSEENRELGGATVSVRRRDASGRDGRIWSVHDVDAPTPKGVKRAHKATGETTPVAVALAVSGEPEGMLYAALPVTTIDLPLRTSAQFDPIASRQGVATNAWNLALVPLVAELWCHAMVALFRENTVAAWRAVPLGGDEQPGSEVLARLKASILDIARSSVADLAEMELAGWPRWIGDLAHEVSELEGRLTEEEVARLARMEAALPASARDSAGRWRLVLDDWHQAGSDITPSVTIVGSLRLLDDTALVAERALALSAIALDHGLEKNLASAKCVITSDGTRSFPPRSQSLDFVVAARSGLAVVLGLGTPLHECHLSDSPDARAVLAWLERRGSILPIDDRAVLLRIAEAGNSGSQLSRRLNDSQLVALRDALEELGQAEWSQLVPAIGRTILIEGIQYDQRGRQTTVDARPSASYIGRSIDKEPDSFAVAADKTPGLIWAAPRYSSVLRSSLGRQGLGALKFLRLLGAETAPRLAPHPGLEKKYDSSPKQGVPAWHMGTPPKRRQAITALGGDYTLDDFHSPDLNKVLQHTAADRKPTRRRARSAALIATLGRAWGALGDHAEVTVADAHYNWNRKGVTRSWWLWKAATTAWLDDDTAKPRRPIDLRLRTSATLALHGADPTGFVHRSFRDARTDVLDALGVAGEPSTAELCEGLVQLRDDPEGSAEDIEAAVLYRAIANHLGSASHTRGDLTPSQLRKSFDDGVGLIHTNLGWRKPSEVFAGRPIFGDRAPFVPAITGVDRLWRTLNIKPPGAQHCISVLAAIGKEDAPPDLRTQTVVLETLRELVRLIEETQPSNSHARRLTRLPLWTTLGWTDKRPVFAVHDPVLVAGLSKMVPVWKPGGEVSQFAALFRPLRLIEVPASAGAVIQAAADVDEDLTKLLRAAIGLLHDDLVRNDPSTANALRIPWTEFEQFDVVVSQELTVRVVEVQLPAGPAEVAVNAKAAREKECIYVTDGDLLGRLDGGGRAIAGLFEADHRRVAQAWLAAMERAVEDQEAEGLRLAQERAAEELRRSDERIEQQTRALQQQVKVRRLSSKKSPSGEKPTEPTQPRGPAGSPPPARRLVDPSGLRVVNPEGDIVGDPTPSRPEKPDKTPPLREPRRVVKEPQQRSSRRAYTEIEKETIGLRLARQVLESDDEAMVDLRAQRGVGADAIDELRQFFELKVYAGAEPDEIRLEDSQVRRAIASSDFFLVVVSGVEEGSAEHKVRIIAQPLKQLHKLDHKDMRVGGIRNSRSLVYRLSSEND